MKSTTLGLLSLYHLYHFILYTGSRGLEPLPEELGHQARGGHANWTGVKGGPDYNTVPPSQDNIIPGLTNSDFKVDWFVPYLSVNHSSL